MEEHTIEAMEAVFQTLVRHEFDFSDVITLGVLTTDDWEYPLPNELLQEKYMTIVITGWSGENSYPTDDGVFITTAFGEQENSKLFKWADIKGIFTKDGLPLIVKPYDPIKEEPKPQRPNLTLKDVMHPETEGLKHSRTKLKRVTPKKKDK